MTVRQLLDQKYAAWESQPLLRAAVCTRLLRAGYSLEESITETSVHAVKAIIKRAQASPPKMHRVTTRTAALLSPQPTINCKVCNQPTMIAKLATGVDAYYCLTCKAVSGLVA